MIKEKDSRPPLPTAIKQPPPATGVNKDEY
jgi:hypothetical protein